MTTIYKCKVVHDTRMRSDPTINAVQSFELLPVGTLFDGIAIKVVSALEVWVQRNDGKWTAAKYPHGTPPTAETFVEFTEQTTTEPPAPTVEIRIKRIVVDYIPVVDGVEQAAQTQIIEG